MDIIPRYTRKGYYYIYRSTGIIRREERPYTSRASSYREDYICFCDVPLHPCAFGHVSSKVKVDFRNFPTYVDTAHLSSPVNCCST